MNPLRRWVVDLLFGFGEPIADDYVPPAPVPSVVTVPVSEPAPVKEQPAERPTIKDTLFGPRCIVCQNLLGKSPSDDFCTDTCQREWMAQHGSPLEKPGLDGVLRIAAIPTRRVG